MTGHHALPDQFIELQLGRIEKRLELIGLSVDSGGPNRLVSFLGPLRFPRETPWLWRQEFGSIFLADEFKNSFDIEKRQAHISKIFDWYSKDFGGKDEKVLEFLAGFLPEDIAHKISSEPRSWKVSHKDYDWSLNDYKPETE